MISTRVQDRPTRRRAAKVAGPNQRRVLSKLSIRCFRGVRDLEFDKLAPVTILTGRNGCGKTSVLEAAFLLCGLSNANLVFSLAAIRALPSIPGVDTAFRALLPELAEEGTALVEGETEYRGEPAHVKLEIAGRIAPVGAGPTTEPRSRLVGVEFRSVSPIGERTGLVEWQPRPIGGAGSAIQLGHVRIEEGPQLRSETPENPDLLPARYVRPQPIVVMAELHGLLTELVKRAAIDEVLELVRLVTPEVRQIQPLVERGQPTIYVDIGADRLYPAAILGGGFVNILQLSAFMCDEASQLMLIDEIEDGLHYTVLPTLAAAVTTFARARGKQFLIATHSRDVAEAFGRIGVQTPGIVTFFKLHRRGDTIEASRFEVEEWQRLEEIGVEIR